MELRCPQDQRVLGVISQPGNVELRCKSRYCGAEPGTVIIHVYHRETGELLYTNRFKDPARRQQ